MATRLESLTVELEAKFGQFKRELAQTTQQTDQAQRRMQGGFGRVGEGIKGVIGQLARFRTAIIGVVGVGGLGLLASRAFDTANALADQADKVGVSVEALQELRYAGSQVGVQQSALDVAIQRFSRRMAAAAQGGGELVKVFQDMDIELRNNDGTMREVEDVLADLADGTAGLTSEQEQLLVAFKAFDTEGAALVNLLKRGSDGVREFQREARELGIVIEESLIRQGAEASLKLQTIGQVIDTKINVALLKMAPLAIEAAGALLRVAEAFDAITSSAVQIDIDEDLVTRAIENTEREILGAYSRLQAVEDEIARRRAAGETVSEQRPNIGLAGEVPVMSDLDRLVAEQAAINGRLEELKRLRGEFQDQLFDLRDGAAGAGAGGGIVGGAGGGVFGGTLGGASNDNSPIVIQLRNTTHWLDEVREKLRDTGAQWAEYTRQADAIRAATDAQFAFNRELEHAIELRDMGFLDEEHFARFEEQLRDRYFPAIEDTGDKFDELSDDADRSFNRISRSLAALVADTVTGTSTMEAAFNRLLSSILGSEGVTSFLESLLRGGLNAIGQGLFGGGGGVGKKTAAFFSGALAGGGTIPMGGFGLVGEAGPELAVPKPGGAEIIPLRPQSVPMASGGNGVVINQSFDFRGADAGAVVRLRAEANRIKAETLAAVPGVVEAQAGRSPTFARAVGRRR